MKKLLICGLFVLLMVCAVHVSATVGYDWAFNGDFPNVNGQTGHLTYGLYKWEGNFDSIITIIDVPGFLEITAFSPICSVASNVVTCSEYNVPKVEYFIDTKVKPDTPIGTCSYPVDHGEPSLDGGARVWSSFQPTTPSGNNFYIVAGPYCVISESPVANAGLDQTVIVNEVVIFDGSGSSDSDGTITTYDWDFGDENYGLGEMTSHTYTTPSTYEVTLTVTDNNGQTDSDTAVITVKTPAQTLQDLITKVDGLGLPKGIEQSLLAKLNTAQNKITQEQNTPARNTLNAFINEVKAQRGKAISAVQANELIAIAQRIINSIPGK